MQLDGFFLRTVKRRHYMDRPSGLDGSWVSTECFWSCKPKKHSISIWHMSSAADADRDLVVTALAAGWDQPQADGLEVAWIEADSIASKFELKQTPGKTPVKTAQDKHYDVINVGTYCLADFIQLFSETIRTGSQIHAYSSYEILELLENAWTNGICTKKPQLLKQHSSGT